jgi:hypothetical protein
MENPAILLRRLNPYSARWTMHAMCTIVGMNLRDEHAYNATTAFLLTLANVASILLTMASLLPDTGARNIIDD